MENELFDIDSSSVQNETTDKPKPYTTQKTDISYIINEPYKGDMTVLVHSSGFKSLGTIIKIIAFFVALAVIGIHTFAAYILFAFKPIYASICIAIVTLGLVLALIILFLIYALGHTINQNNEILDLLRKTK